MAKLTTPVNGNDHRMGPENAPATLVEYGDFECEYCGAAFPIVKQVQSEMGEDLQFVFRQFPLAQSHPHAELAAEASEAAAAQGRFWEMHDQLYRHQDALTMQSLLEYAGLIGLDIERFHQDLKSHRYAENVRDDFMSGVRSGVNGTPTFFINGERYEGYNDLPGLLESIRAALTHGEAHHSR